MIRGALLGAVLAAWLILAACGDLEDEGASDEARGTLTEGTTNAANEPAEDLPARPAGIVQIDGRLDGSLTDATLIAFGRETADRGLAVQTDTARTDETAGFEALCAGETDIVDAARPISEEELEACRSNGLDVVDFQIAFDATVVVTRNERDVGADCVSFEQLRTMFEAGSPITAWNQVNPNFSPLRLVPTGPEESSPHFALFGQRVLGVDDPTLANVRSDYLAFPNELDVKEEVADSPPGSIGIVSFRFYELFEDKLRPLEIDGGTGDRCVFPSAETVAAELYPLERTLRLYTTQRSLDRQEVETFLRFYLEGAENLADRRQLIPISDAVLEQELDRLTDPDAYDEEPAEQTTATTEAAP
jgi:phosphate transport system substrate-binding protein